jgi:hypothetical protein
MERISPVDPTYVACAFDPSYFMERAYMLQPDPWQRDLLLKTPERMLLLCSRQSGKSTVSATMAMHKAVFYPGSLVLILSNAFRQAEETFKKHSEKLSLGCPL